MGYAWADPKTPIGEEKIIVISKDKIVVDDLPKFSMLKYTKNPFLKNLIDNWWQRNFNIPPLINMEVNYVETCKEMVKNGLGYAIVPEYCLRANDKLNKLILLDENNHPLTRNTWMNYNMSSSQIPTVSIFIDFIIHHDNCITKDATCI